MSSESDINGRAEIIVSIAAVILGLLICFYLIPTQIQDPSPKIPNAKTFPYVLGAFFTLLSCYWVYDAVRRNARGERSKAFPRHLFVGLGIGVVFYLFGYLIGTLGYIIGGIIAMFAVIYAIEGKERLLLALVSSVVVTACFVVVFGKLLNIELPIGILTFLE
ncbi:MAG: tripartite tricarboxylate transporter TctB family protein [bacterium]|nr:tripartite tricarboxylate transporter TctB family protein [bacterium]